MNTPKKFRKKLVIVEAEQWFPGKKVAGIFGGPGDDEEPYFIITIHGQHAYLTPGDWIVKGEDSPMHADIFEQTYESVKEQE